MRGQGGRWHAQLVPLVVELVPEVVELVLRVVDPVTERVTLAARSVALVAGTVTRPAHSIEFIAQPLGVHGAVEHLGDVHLSRCGRVVRLVRRGRQIVVTIVGRCPEGEK